ncbi:Methyltransferase domain-containing protein [Cupriavidus sp. YR651]|uniref:class I SAM-dependent methyltransferase n=1 Tax=Cupriavidus sp. YR651 TaxID=1855315 RepID=UPI0008811187|nr:class I SAM-dependent methyltransferase [Cupriavidus sp. YR651]SDC22173.1 Methyltransferase domain-containing protein [Cupriavidus sp. YR651]
MSQGQQANSGAGFHEEDFATLARLESDSFWFRARNELILWATRPLLRGGMAFCEIGCGTGFVISALADTMPAVKFTGTELFGNGLQFARERVPAADFHEMDARKIPFRSQFDVVGTFDVLEHIDEDEVVLAEIYKALKPDGKLVITVPQHPFLWSYQDERACHVRRYTRTEMIEKLNRAGFSIKLTTSFVSFLLPALCMARRSSRVQAKDYDPAADLRLNPVTNALMLGIMFVERQFIKFGVRFPLGGSLLVVATKAR